MRAEQWSAARGWWGWALCLCLWGLSSGCGGDEAVQTDAAVATQEPGASGAGLHDEVEQEPSVPASVQLAAASGSLRSESYRVNVQVGLSLAPASSESSGVTLQGAAAVRPTGAP